MHTSPSFAAPFSLRAAPRGDLGCAGCGGELGGFWSDVVSFTVDLAEDIGDWFANLGDEIGDWFEDAADEAWPAVRDYLERKVSDPAWWSKALGTVGACLATGGAGCPSAVLAFVQSEVVAAACVQAKTAAISAARSELIRSKDEASHYGAAGDVALIRRQIDRLDAETARIGRMTPAEKQALGDRVSTMSPKGRQAVEAAQARLLQHARAQELKAAVERVQRAAQARLADLYEEGRQRILSAGYTFWGPAGAFYPLDEYVRRRVAGGAERSTFFAVVPPAAVGMARAQIRAEFPALRRMPATVRSMTTAYINGGGLRDRSAGMTAVRSALAQVQRDFHDRAVGAGRPDAGAGAARPRGAEVPPPARQGGPRMPAGVQPKGPGLQLDADVQIKPDAQVPPQTLPDAAPAPGSGAGKVLLFTVVAAFGVVAATRRRAA